MENKIKDTTIRLLRADTWDEIEEMLNTYVVEQKQKKTGEQ